MHIIRVLDNNVLLLPMVKASCLPRSLKRAGQTTFRLECEAEVSFEGVAVPTVCCLERVTFSSFEVIAGRDSWKQ